MTDDSDMIHPRVTPSGDGCVECDATGSWWVHLRRCAACGHVGCCDDSLKTHATRHWEATGHAVIQSYEPGETWAYDYRDQSTFEGVELAAPTSHPVDQSVPGPADRLPADWLELLGGSR